MNNIPVNILLVEDEKIIAMEEAEELSSEGFNVIIAGSGEKAIEIVGNKSNKIDIILMDIDLGEGMDGTKTALEIQTIRNIPIIFNSHHTDKKILKKIEEITSFGFVAKNSGTAVLISSIKMALRLYEAIDSTNQQKMLLEATNEELQATNEELLATNEEFEAANEELTRSQQELIEKDTALAESEEKYSKAFYLSPDSINLNRLDDGVYVAINKGFTEMVGYTEEEVIGKSSLSCDLGIWTNDKDRERLISGLREKGEVIGLETGFRRKDGSILIGSMSAKIINIKEVPCVLTITRNITEQKKAQEALRESEEKYRKIVETANEGIWYLDKEFNTTFVNNRIALMLGYSRQEMLNMPITNFIFENDIEDLNQRILERKEGKNSIYERQFKRKDGTGIWSMVSATSLTDKNGNFAGSFVMITDISEKKLAEEKMKESENKYRNIFSAVTDSIFLIERETGNILEINDAACRRYGYTREEMLKLGSADISNEPDKTKLAIKNNESFIPLRYHKTKNGEIFPVDISNSTFFLNGKPVVLAAIRDISIRKKAEDELKKEKSIIDAIFNSIPGIIYMYDDNSKLVRWNKKHEELTGYSSDELYGMNLMDWYKDDEKSQKAVLIGVEKTLKEGFGSAEADIQTKHGHIIPMFFTASVIMIDGRQHFVGIGLDITERRKNYEILKNNEARQNAMIENISDVIAIIDREGIIRYKSPNVEKWFGWKSEELTGKKALENVHPDDIDDTKKLFNDIINGAKSTANYEFRYKCKDGTYKWIESTSSNMLHVPDINGILLNYRDISERKKMEERIRQAEKMQAIGTLAGGIAHDFNNILGAIIGFTELSLMTNDLSEEISKNLNETLKAGFRAKELVSQILLFSRQTDQSRAPVSPDQIINEAVNLLKASIPSNITIRQKINSSSTFMAVPTQIHQVIINLCTNASYAMKEKGGFIDINLDEIVLEGNDSSFVKNNDLSPGKYLKMSIADTGTGIPREIVDKIFDPFFTTKPQGEGTGMGLSMVHGIVKNMGGTITVYSEVEQGSVFNVFLPITTAENNDQSESHSPTPVGTETILLIDDEPMLVDIGKTMLGRFGYKVEGFDDSTAAIKELINNPKKYDAVITDKTMPGMTGIDVAKKIKELGLNIPVLMCTGYGDSLSAKTAQEAGIEEIIQKPFNAVTLSKTIRKLLDKKKNPNL